MSGDYDFDVAVVGGGPAGYVAAIRASQRGAEACVIEKGHLGGVCTNVGCIPTKVLWRTAELMLELGDSADFGVSIENATLDWPKVGERRDQIIEMLRGGIRSLLEGNDVELIRGAASFTDEHTLKVEGREGPDRLSADKIIIATGSKAVELPMAPFDHKVVLDSDDAVGANELPESIIVIGGGYIGVEFGSIYAACGVDVTIVEMLDRLLPEMDADCAREVTKALKKNGAKVQTGTKLQEVSTDDGGVRATLSSGEELSAQKMLVCVGRNPDCGGMEIGNAGLQTAEHGGVVVNEHLQSAQPHIYAAGDVAGPPLLAHVGSHEGVIAANHATGMVSAVIDYRVIPACVFVHPEVATVGMLEEEARENVGEITVKQFPFRALGKAHIMGTPDGLAKMIADAETGEILGVHIAAVDASSLLGEASLAMQLECTAEELAHTIHAHPTLAEAMAEVAQGVAGMPINWRG